VTKKPENRLASVVAIRLPKKVKEELISEATVLRKTLSEYVFDLIKAGWEVKQGKAKDGAINGG
jgi:hypothetical protein